MKEPPQPDLLKDFEEDDLMKGGRIFFQKVLNLFPLLNRRVKVNPVFSTEKMSISNQDKYEYINADNYFPTRSENELIDWSTKLINQEKRSLRIAELLFFECNYAYLFEIEPVKQHSIYSKEDQHTMFLCYKNNGFGKLSNSQIQEILTICAKNEGSWLEKEELDWLGRYKFKHSSKTYKRYAVRILTELKKAKWFVFKQSYK